MSQTQLAQAVGVQRSAVSHWEAPQGKNPSVKHLREIAMVTGVQFEWLATGRGQMAPSRDTVLDSVAAADALLVDDSLEQRLLMAFRESPVRARLALVELMEELAASAPGGPVSVPRSPTTTRTSTRSSKASCRRVPYGAPETAPACPP